MTTEESARVAANTLSGCSGIRRRRFERRASRGPALGDGRAALVLLLLDALLLEAGVVERGLLGRLDGGDLERLEAALALEHDGRDEALDLGHLGHSFALLVLERALDDVLAHVVLLREREELADLVGALRAEPHGDLIVGEPGDVVVAGLDDHEVQHGEVVADDAAAHGLALALARAPLPVAAVAALEQQAHAVVAEDALLHGEALLVVAARHAEYEARVFVTQ
mmetsp:Transcript_25459/g.101470  ORF Transcript_25459/g.101470 Transcript_25459/m.101470 type:complete len:225 (-) Transcript_25459:201-875(-)